MFATPDLRPATWEEAIQRCNQWNAPATYRVILSASKCQFCANTCLLLGLTVTFEGLAIYFGTSTDPSKNKSAAYFPGFFGLIPFGNYVYSCYNYHKYRNLILADELTPDRPYLNRLLDHDACGRGLRDLDTMERCQRMLNAPPLL